MYLMKDDIPWHSNPIRILTNYCRKTHFINTSQFTPASP